MPPVLGGSGIKGPSLTLDIFALKSQNVKPDPIGFPLAKRSSGLSDNLSNSVGKSILGTVYLTRLY